MRHVAPHRWADAWAGRLDAGVVEAMDRHAEACARCAKARDRITRASSSFPAMRAQSTPEVGWDSVRARVHWSLAAERRARTQAKPGRAKWRFAFGALAAGGVVAAIASGSLATRGQDRAPGIAQIAPTVRSTPGALHGLVSRLAGDVLVDGLRAGAFERRIDAGAVLATGDGRVDVQFGERSAFALGAHSKLQLRRLDAAQIELVVDGTVDVEVAPRAPGQRFLVIAGSETVEVRGTQFRVARDPSGAVRVVCSHGLVAVRDGSGEKQVGAARALDVHAGGAVADARVVQISADELAQLVAATPVTTPLWSDADSAAKSSTALEIATQGKRDVRLDGVELGEAPLRVRVVPGRHTVETADAVGRYHRAGWVDTSADHPAHVDVHAEPAAAAAPSSAERRRQLHAGLAAHHTQLARCTRAMIKAGVTDLSVEIGIAVTAKGDVDHLNVDADLPATTRSCIEDVLHDVRFGRGAAAEWREKLPL